MLDSSSFVLKKVVNDLVWLQIAELWLTMSEEDETILVTENTLLQQLGKDKKVNLNKQPETNSFLLLITSKLDAFLRREETTEPKKYQITLPVTEQQLPKNCLSLVSRENGKLLSLIIYKQTSSKNQLIVTIFLPNLS